MRELENDHAVRWGLTTYRKSLIEPASDVFAALSSMAFCEPPGPPRARTCPSFLP